MLADVPSLEHERKICFIQVAFVLLRVGIFCVFSGGEGVLGVVFGSSGFGLLMKVVALCHS